MQDVDYNSGAPLAEHLATIPPESMMSYSATREVDWDDVPLQLPPGEDDGYAASLGATVAMIEQPVAKLVAENGEAAAVTLSHAPEAAPTADAAAVAESGSSSKKEPLPGDAESIARAASGAAPEDAKELGLAQSGSSSGGAQTGTAVGAPTAGLPADADSGAESGSKVDAKSGSAPSFREPEITKLDLSLSSFTAQHHKVEGRTLLLGDSEAVLRAWTSSDQQHLSQAVVGGRSVWGSQDKLTEAFAAGVAAYNSERTSYAEATGKADPGQVHFVNLGTLRFTEDSGFLRRNLPEMLTDRFTSDRSNSELRLMVAGSRESVLKYVDAVDNMVKELEARGGFAAAKNPKAAMESLSKFREHLDSVRSALDDNERTGPLLMRDAPKVKVPSTLESARVMVTTRVREHLSANAEKQQAKKLGLPESVGQAVGETVKLSQFAADRIQRLNELVADPARLSATPSADPTHNAQSSVRYLRALRPEVIEGMQPTMRQEYLLKAAAVLGSVEAGTYGEAAKREAFASEKGGPSFAHVIKTLAAREDTTSPGWRFDHGELTSMLDSKGLALERGLTAVQTPAPATAVADTGAAPKGAHADPSAGAQAGSPGTATPEAPTGAPAKAEPGIPSAGSSQAAPVATADPAPTAFQRNVEPLLQSADPESRAKAIDSFVSVLQQTKVGHLALMAQEERQPLVSQLLVTAEAVRRGEYGEAAQERLMASSALRGGSLWQHAQQLGSREDSMSPGWRTEMAPQMEALAKSGIVSQQAVQATGFSREVAPPESLSAQIERLASDPAKASNSELASVFARVDGMQHKQVAALGAESADEQRRVLGGLASLVGEAHTRRDDEVRAMGSTVGSVVKRWTDEHQEQVSARPLVQTEAPVLASSPSSVLGKDLAEQPWETQPKVLDAVSAPMQEAPRVALRDAPSENAQPAQTLDQTKSTIVDLRNEFRNPATTFLEGYVTKAPGATWNAEAVVKTMQEVASLDVSNVGRLPAKDVAFAHAVASWTHQHASSGALPGSLQEEHKDLVRQVGDKAKALSEMADGLPLTTKDSQAMGRADRMVKQMVMVAVHKKTMDASMVGTVEASQTPRDLGMGAESKAGVIKELLDQAAHPGPVSAAYGKYLIREMQGVKDRDLASLDSDTRAEVTVAMNKLVAMADRGDLGSLKDGQLKGVEVLRDRVNTEYAAGDMTALIRAEMKIQGLDQVGTSKSMATESAGKDATPVRESEGSAGRTPSAPAAERQMDR